MPPFFQEQGKCSRRSRPCAGPRPSRTTAARSGLIRLRPNEEDTMTAEQLYTIIGSNVVAIALVGGLVGTFFLRTVARLDRRIDNDKAAADADRRAWQQSMDDFKKEMRRIAERQSRVEGRLESAPGD